MSNDKTETAGKIVLRISEYAAIVAALSSAAYTLFFNKKEEKA